MTNNLPKICFWKVLFDLVVLTYPAKSWYLVLFFNKAKIQCNSLLTQAIIATLKGFPSSRFLS